MRKTFYRTKLVFLTAFFLNLASFAETPCAKVAAVIGEVLNQDGLALQTGQALPKKSKIITRDSSWVKLILIDDSIIDLGSASELTITACQAENFNNKLNLQMELGSLRALVNKTNKKKRDGFEIKTPTSVLAVRGTEFFISRQEGEKGDVLEQVGVKEGIVEVRSLFDDMMKPYLVNAGAEFQAAGRIEQENGKTKIEVVAPPKIDQFSAEEQKQLEERTKIEPNPLEEAVDLSPQSSNGKTEKSKNEKLASFVESTQKQEREVASTSQLATAIAEKIITSKDPTSAGTQNTNGSVPAIQGPTPILIKAAGTWGAAQ